MNNLAIDASDNDVYVPTENQPVWLDKLQRIASLSEVLRILGACAVLASMSLFLMNGWAEGNDIQRYLKLLAQTGLLTAAGIGLSVVLKEYKGARLFFGLSLVSVAANFTILGALIYSMVQWDNALQEYPAALTWQTVEFASFWPVFGGAALLLAVLSRFSFGIFARAHANLLSVAFMVSCTCLLLPVRDSLGISVLVMVTGFIALKVMQAVRRDERFVNTPEANFALATLFVAPAIMLVRALSLYHVDEMLAITLSGLALFALRAMSLRESVRAAEHLSGLQRLSGIGQFLLAVNISMQLTGLVVFATGDLITLGVFLFAMLGFTVEFVFSQRHQHARSHYLLWGAAVVLIAALFGAFISSGVDFILLALGASLACFALARYCATLETRVATALSSVVILLSGGMLVFQLIESLNLGNWVLVGVSGGALIVGGSLYERFGLRLTAE